MQGLEGINTEKDVFLVYDTVSFFFYMISW